VGGDPQESWCLDPREEWVTTGADTGLVQWPLDPAALTEATRRLAPQAMLQGDRDLLR